MMNFKVFTLLICLLCSIAVVKPQTTTAPQTILIRAGRVFDSEKGVLLPARDINQ